MVTKKRGIIITIGIVLIISALNLFLFFNKKGTSYSTISGMMIKGIPENLNLNMPFIAFIAQWVILLLIVIVAWINFLKHKKQEEISIKEALPFINYKKTKSQTDLDTLYNLLKQKKELTIGTISNLFRISKEKSLEWAKILEDHELVIIEYPAFDDASVKIIEKQIENPSTKQTIKQDLNNKSKEDLSENKNKKANINKNLSITNERR